MGFSFFRKRSLPDSFAALDLGSGGVRCVIFDAGRAADRKLSIAGLGAEPFPEGTVNSGLVLNLDSFIETSRTALKKASFDCGYYPDHLVLGLSGELVKAISAKVRVIRSLPLSPFRSAELSSYEGRIKESLSQEAGSEFSLVTGSSELSLKLIERKLVLADSSNLSGPIADPLPELKFHFLISFTQESSLKLMELLVRGLKKKELFKTSRIVNLVRLIKNGDLPNYILVNLERSSTDLSLVLDRSLIGVRTIPLGASNLEGLRGDGENEAPVSEENLNDEARDWFRAIEYALRDFEGIKTYPSEIILDFVDEDLPRLRDFLSFYAWDKRIPFIEAPLPLSLEELLDFSCFEDKTGKIRGFLSAVSLGRSFFDYVED